MKIYLAGKIKKNDWRGALVPWLEDLMPEDWHKTVTLDMDGRNEYVGPFFVACDHGCAHGSNGHGAVGGGCSVSLYLKMMYARKVSPESRRVICSLFERTPILPLPTERLRKSE